jgi:hypothetical protein
MTRPSAQLQLPKALSFNEAGGEGPQGLPMPIARYRSSSGTDKCADMFDHLFLPAAAYALILQTPLVATAVPQEERPNRMIASYSTGARVGHVS